MLSKFFKDVFKKDFWSFTLKEKTKKARLVFVSVLTVIGIIYSIVEPESNIWKIVGVTLCFCWWVLNIAQLYNTYYKITYIINGGKK